LDESCCSDLRSEIEKHLSECPNCFVICDTTKKTLQVYKGMQAQALPSGLKARLMSALAERQRGRKPADC
jgi:hypothetical protein